MAGCQLTPSQIEQAVDFHGHWCPGLAIGLRAGEYVINNLGRADDEEVVALVETDMCAVDAIQVLTNCTFGKGNLKFQDHGKLAFTFFRRKDGSGVRLVFDADRLGSPDSEFTELNRQWLRDEISPEDKQRLMAMREERSKDIMSAPLEELFTVKEPAVPMPRSARILTSLKCEDCGEAVMESRTRRLEGRTLCIACYQEQG
ncbi:MAG: TraR/DksA C4-type zinc finger protein [Desulfarculaceae bacterium]|nr:TraR/DksA C4-type zinc finger protein [Desulfarculaceae bacterium]MCF8071490.1 TraR/DksA C4-type zinc finger protein [Desulfarculaceae bacterium]MCF8102305.1 TraR/DksA C4-type zinc finger protein [Desulfarculaceae bacterium]MCF8114769.1 TraR/DksA C4-type zinc finger protein [Desulfarculaceae bacterium]